MGLSLGVHGTNNNAFIMLLLLWAHVNSNQRHLSQWQKDWVIAEWFLLKNLVALGCNQITVLAKEQWKLVNLLHVQWSNSQGQTAVLCVTITHGTSSICKLKQDDVCMLPFHWILYQGFSAGVQWDPVLLIFCRTAREHTETGRV